MKTIDVFGNVCVWCTGAALAVMALVSAGVLGWAFLS